MKNEKQPPNRMIRKSELLERIAVSDATIWRWEKEGKFPKRVWIGKNSVAWLENEIDAWFAEKASTRG